MKVHFQLKTMRFYAEVLCQTACKEFSLDKNLCKEVGSRQRHMADQGSRGLIVALATRITHRGIHDPITFQN